MQFKALIKKSQNKKFIKKLQKRRIRKVFFTKEELSIIQNAMIQYTNEKNYAICNDIYIKIDYALDFWYDLQK